MVLDHLAAAPQVDLMLPLPLDPRLRQIYRSLELHPEQPTTLGDWSRKLAVSEKTLSRLFLRDTGLTFRAWRRGFREADLVLYPLCPVTVANEALRRIYAPVLTGRREIALGRCWKGYMKPV